MSSYRWFAPNSVLWISSISTWWWLGLLDLNLSAFPVLWSLMTLLKFCLILSFLMWKQITLFSSLAARFFSLHTGSCCFLQTMEIFPVAFKAVRMLSHMVASVTAEWRHLASLGEMMGRNEAFSPSYVRENPLMSESEAVVFVWCVQCEGSATSPWEAASGKGNAVL